MPSEPSWSCSNSWAGGGLEKNDPHHLEGCLEEDGGQDWLAKEYQKDFQALPPARQAGYYVREVLKAAREETGLATSTIMMYVNTRVWKHSNRPLKTTAKVLARALDLFLRGKSTEAMDVIAGRLRALVHVDLYGKWRDAEALQADRSKDVGLASGRDIYLARREARLFGGDSSSEDAEPTHRKKQKKRRNRKPKPPKKEGAAKKEGD